MHLMLVFNGKARYIRTITENGITWTNKQSQALFIHDKELLRELIAKEIAPWIEIEQMREEKRA